VNRLHIFIILIVVAVGAALGLSYQFYFKEKLNEYTKAQEDLDKLTKRLTELQNRFKGQPPETYIKGLTEKIAPLTNVAEVRQQFFNMNDYWKDETVPEDVKVPLKFYYERQYNERLNALRQDALAHVPPIGIPPNIFQRFGAPDPATMTNMAVLKADVQRWLTQINFASAIVRMMIKANVGRLDEVVPWPPREEFGALEMRTIGLSFVMRAEDLIAFLQSLQRENRYFNVNALRVKNRNLLSDPALGQPYLEVEMLLTLSRQIPGKTAVAAAGGASAGAASGMTPALSMQALGDIFGRNSSGEGQTTTVRKKKSFWSKLWPF
jgi:hypothetical protein